MLGYNNWRTCIHFSALDNVKAINSSLPAKVHPWLRQWPDIFIPEKMFLFFQNIINDCLMTNMWYQHLSEAHIKKWLFLFSHADISPFNTVPYTFVWAKPLIASNYQNTYVTCAVSIFQVIVGVEYEQSWYFYWEIIWCKKMTKELSKFWRVYRV